MVLEHVNVAKPVDEGDKDVVHKGDMDHQHLNVGKPMVKRDKHVVHKGDMVLEHVNVAKPVDKSEKHVVHKGDMDHRHVDLGKHVVKCVKDVVHEADMAIEHVDTAKRQANGGKDGRMYVPQISNRPSWTREACNGQHAHKTNVLCVVKASDMATGHVYTTKYL